MVTLPFSNLSRVPSCAQLVGIHRYFHVLTMQSLVFKETGRLIHIEDIWAKLEACYNLEQLVAWLCQECKERKDDLD